MNNNEIKKDNDSRKILSMIIMIATLMICTTGATYAYFAITSPTDNTITGNAATASLFITNDLESDKTAAPTPIAPTTTANQNLPMVPQISYTGTTNVLQKAFNGSGDKCVDANGNVICKAYTFVVRNLSTANLNVRGKIAFTYSDTFTNLRWKLMDSATAVTVSTKTASTTFSATAPVAASTSDVYFDTTNVFLAAAGGSKQYWLIVWIEETGGNQNSTDKGTFVGTITFDVFDTAGNTVGGITSTITS